MVLAHLCLLAYQSVGYVHQYLVEKTSGYAIQGVFWTTTQWVKIGHVFHKIIHRYETLREITRSLSVLYSQIHKMSVSHLVETDSSGYFCLCSYHLSLLHPEKCDRDYSSLSSSQHYHYDYSEKYEYFESTPLLTDSQIHDSVNLYYEYVDRHRSILENVYHSMCIFKYDNKYIVREYPIWNPEMEIMYRPSAARFMIEYTHPNQSHQITLVIPKSMYMAGNHILSFLFVLRLLKYQPEPFHFDMDYTLKVIDDDVNILELKSHQFIVLTEDGYEIKERDIQNAFRE